MRSTTTWLAAALLLVPASLSALSGPTATAAAPAAQVESPDPSDTRTFLVTLTGPGGGARTARDASPQERQERLRSRYALPAPEQRWTTALNGFSVRLSDDQAARLRRDPAVALVQPDRTLTPEARTVPGLGGTTPGSGGRGVIVGVIGSGISTDTAALARHEVVRSRVFVTGYGRSAVRSTDPLDGRDTTGQGTAIAALAVGAPRVSRDLRLQGEDEFSGTAPAARVASYKACWTAPDPARDGCALSDVVAALDAATRDRVEVAALPLRVPTGSPTDRSTLGRSTLDRSTLDRAVIGAQEAGVVVVTGGARGGAPSGVSAVARPGARPTGTLSTPAGSFSGTMLADRDLPRTRVVTGRSIGTRAAPEAQAAQCVPGTLDAAQARGALVVCERGGVARADKSQAVALADGVAMVLTNAPGSPGERWPDDTPIDLHAVPTLHLDRAQSRALYRALDRTRPDTPMRGELRSTGLLGNGGVVGSDGAVIAPKPRSADPRRWGVLDAASAAVARLAGRAAQTRARHPRWSADRVAAALTGTPQDARERRRAWERARTSAR